MGPCPHVGIRCLSLGCFAPATLSIRVFHDYFALSPTSTRAPSLSPLTAAQLAANIDSVRHAAGVNTPRSFAETVVLYVPSPARRMDTRCCVRAPCRIR